jgi:hypothetical protein
VAAPPGSARIPEEWLPPEHLLHANARDEYHGCIGDDMMIKNEEQCLA